VVRVDSHALDAEVAARVVVRHVEDDGEAVQVAQVDQRLALIQLAAQVAGGWSTSRCHESR
jgi:hypothetical protein